MVITGDDKILLRKFRLSKKWGVEKFTRDFPNKKNWRSYKTGDVQRYPGSGRQSTLRVPDNISTIENLVLSQNNVFINKKLMLIK